MQHQPEYMLGVDIGTTSTKAVLFTTQGQVVAQHAVEYPLLCTTPGMAEQDPLQIYDAVLSAIKNAVGNAAGKNGVEAAQIKLVSFSAAMHSVIAVGQDGALLSNSITWGDNRAGAWANRIRDELGGHEIYLRTGTPIHPMSPLCKIMWLRHDQPQLFARTARFVGVKEYVLYRLFGDWLVDHSIASATGMFNLQQLDWDQGALELLGIGPQHLSTLVPTTHHLSGLAPAMAQQLGLAPATPFVIGANDGVLSNLGVNAIGPGQVAVTIGTSGAMRTVIDKPLTDPSGRTFCYALTAKHWVVGGPTNNGGSIFHWVRDELATAEAAAAKAAGLDPYDALTNIAEGVSAGAEGLLFHPYLAGERAPLWNADARGSYFGLATHHGKPHMIRAALEGVIFSLYSILPAVEDLIGPTTHMMATGGFARSSLWRQMMADIFEREVVVPESVESSCLGAAVLGLYALGKVDSLDVIGGMVGSTHRHVPIAENVALYRRLWPIYAAIPKQLEQQYRLLSQFQRETAASPS
ncbi:gluconokinase [Collimonas fungivorans]|uniref:Gluconokinase n=1 Tax=Collimonas fungivorans (strain Ter331) TaxID=1005048 RepID=G0AFS3_COLFT|nr:gluconokinase [Collimonas fungivorans]AEK64243.1 Gluconokinase [Collimonas fungivorans Ter331]